MKLKDILGDTPVYIEYRTFYDGMDILGGYCFWTGSKIVSADGDDYSIEDIISDYKWASPSNLIVWYESMWIKN